MNCKKVSLIWMNGLPGGVWFFNVKNVRSYILVDLTHTTATVTQFEEKKFLQSWRKQILVSFKIHLNHLSTAIKLPERYMKF